MVSEDGREFYAESSEFDELKCDEFVRREVLPKLGPKEQRKTVVEIRQALLDFIGDESPRWIAYFSSFDHVVLASIFGGMSDFPAHFEKYSYDIKQKMDELGVKKLTRQNRRGAHNALSDARWLKTETEKLIEQYGLVIPRSTKKKKR